MRVLRAFLILIGSVLGGVSAILVGARAGAFLNAWFGGALEPEVTEAFGGLVVLIAFLSGLVALLARQRARRILRAHDDERGKIKDAQQDDPYLREAELLLLRLKGFYETIQFQSSVSHLAALTAMFVTLVALLGTLYFAGFIASGDESPLLTRFSAFCGALSSFIGATFQRNYRRTSAELRQSRQQLEQRRAEIGAVRLSLQLGEEGRRIRAEWVRRTLRLVDTDGLEQTSLGEPSTLRAAEGARA